jgi:hypothetical protein
MTTTSSTRAEPGIDEVPTEPDEPRRASATTLSVDSGLYVLASSSNLDRDDLSWMGRIRRISVRSSSSRSSRCWRVGAVALGVFSPTRVFHVAKK